MASKDKHQLIRAERLILVGEADSRVKLRVSGKSPLNTRHTDQDQAYAMAVVVVPQLLEGWGLQTICFIDDHQLHEAAPTDVEGRAALGGDRVWVNGLLNRPAHSALKSVESLV